MTELKKQENGARPSLGRAFLNRQGFAPPSLQAHFVFWSLMAGGIALDLWSKKAVFDWLSSNYP